MSKIIPNEVLDNLEALLKERIHAKVISRSGGVMHVKSSKHLSMGWLEVAMEKVSLETSNYGVLLEEEGDPFAVEFTHFGYYFTNEKLAKKFGGCVSNNRYWILYNEKGGMYGYTGDHMPTAEEIIQFIENLYEKK